MQPAAEVEKPAIGFRVIKNKSWSYLLYSGGERMIAGFTGSRDGMTSDQKDTFGKLLGMSKVVEFHHGDCVGADEQAHGIIQALIYAGMANIKLVGHPPSDPKLQALCDFDEVRTQRPYLVRNRVIVNETDCLIATPSSMQEIEKGGTWFTIRYARQKEKPILLIWPDGTLDVQHPTAYSPVPWGHATS